MLVPSAQIESVLAAVAPQLKDSEQMRSLRERAAEFASPLQMTLTGIALDPGSRDLAEQVLDNGWSAEARRTAALESGGFDREVIIGSGFHAAVYAAVRVRRGFPRPLVLERSHRAGGTFAMTARPTFYLNSRNRAGRAGLAGDQGASLNYLPGAVIQAADLSMAEYQTNTDMAFVIRLALAQFADVVTDTRVIAIDADGVGVKIGTDQRPPVRAGRIIDARGLGDPLQDLTNGTTVVTFEQFMRRMAAAWPLRGLRRVAVVGGGDSAKCAIESLLGIAPPPWMAAATLDSVERIDCYSDSLPDTCERWQTEIRGRYQAIGRYLRRDGFGVQRLAVVRRRVSPISLPDAAIIEDRTYDLVIVCTGYRENTIDDLGRAAFTEYAIPGAYPVALEHDYLPAYRVGPHARLPFTAREREDGIAAIAGNRVSMFRTASKTAALAATLPSLQTPA